jgi:glycosyltransferase involved in cell wall biosynthesis
MNVPRPRVSVLLPAFNGGGTLSRAIASIYGQTMPDWELIIVDDGSTDDTPALIRLWAAQDDRIRPLRRPHEGIVSTLNAGLASAHAPIIARMDADDEAHPERLAEQLAWLERQPDVGVVGCLVEFGGDPARAADYALHVAWINSVVTEEEISLNRFVESPFAHPSILFRRQLANQHGGYRQGEFPEDYELWLRWLRVGVRMAKVPRVLLTWNDLPDRLSRRDPRYNSTAFYRCKAAYLAQWLQRHVSPGRTLLIWGAGRLTRRRAGHLTSHGIKIGGYIDIDPRKIGRSQGGRSVLAPEQIPAAGSCFVIGYVGKRGARAWAQGYLRTLGFVEGRDFIMAA